MNRTEQIVIQLERSWPGWQVWVVHRVIDGPLYCARLRADERTVLNAGTPDELEEQIRQQGG